MHIVVIVVLVCPILIRDLEPIALGLDGAAHTTISQLAIIHNVYTYMYVGTDTCTIFISSAYRSPLFLPSSWFASALHPAIAATD